MAMSMCTYLTITDTCSCLSIIEIKIEGEIISGDVDLFSVISLQNYCKTFVGKRLRFSNVNLLFLSLLLMLADI